MKDSRKEAVQHLGLLLDRKIGVHSRIGLDREDELFQSKRESVLLHIFGKELDVRIKISADDRYELDEKSGFNENAYLSSPRCSSKLSPVIISGDFRSGFS